MILRILAWESRSPPGLFFKSPRIERFGGFFYALRAGERDRLLDEKNPRLASSLAEPFAAFGHCLLFQRYLWSYAANALLHRSGSLQTFTTFIAVAFALEAFGITALVLNRFVFQDACS